MRSLGLDPSLRAFGWCVYDSKAGPSARRVASGHDGTLSTHVPVTRYMHFRSVVRDLLRRFDVDMVGIESPAYDAGPFAEQHFGLMMFALEAVFDARKDCVVFDPATVKGMVGKSSGKGALSKLDMQRFVQLDTMDPSPINDNEADAYCIARFAARFSELRAGALLPEDLSDGERRTFLERTRKVNTFAGKVVRRTAHVFRENSRFFEFSRVPAGDVNLPAKGSIRPELAAWLDVKDELEK